MTTKERDMIERNVRLWERQRGEREERERQQLVAQMDREDELLAMHRVKVQATGFANTLPL